MGARIYMVCGRRDIGMQARFACRYRMRERGVSQCEFGTRNAMWTVQNPHSWFVLVAAVRVLELRTTTGIRNLGQLELEQVRPMMDQKKNIYLSS